MGGLVGPPDVDTSVRLLIRSVEDLIFYASHKNTLSTHATNKRLFKSSSSVFILIGHQRHSNIGFQLCLAETFYITPSGFTCCSYTISNTMSSLRDYYKMSKGTCSIFLLQRRQGAKFHMCSSFAVLALLRGTNPTKKPERLILQ